jgi:hypothetical protein
MYPPRFVIDAHGYPGGFAHSREWLDCSATTNGHELPPSQRDQRLVPSIANVAPCGSRQFAIQLPPGTCVGPWMVWPPPSGVSALLGHRYPGDPFAILSLYDGLCD